MPIPDPRIAAEKDASRFSANPVQWTEGPIERVLKDSPFADRDALLAGLDGFHAERMGRTPSAAAYPEAGAWVDYVREVDRLVQEKTGFSDKQMAIARSLQPYLRFRGYAQLAEQGAISATRGPAPDERCRAAYFPESDRGQVMMKNLDDPATFWTGEGKPSGRSNCQPGLRMEGASSGLHMEVEPDELFPLPVQDMRRAAGIEDTPGAVEFFTRYCLFWSGGNRLMFDDQKRAVAIEKTSVHFIDVYEPHANGSVHISGMAQRDPSTAQYKYVRDQRQKYCDLFGLDESSPDHAYWNLCDAGEQKLGDYLASLPSKPAAEDIWKIFITETPDGFNKPGMKFHPEQLYLQYTLMTQCWLPDENAYVRWQRDPETLAWPNEYEYFQFD